MDDFSALANPEETFFQHGYQDGYAHGRLHGLIEGRAAGKEKGIELWEEVGYYRGFALLWKSAGGSDKSTPTGRIQHNVSLLLSAIDRFPMTNPKSSATSVDATVAPESDELDITRLLSQTRSRYRTLCAVLGVRPRLRAVAAGEEQMTSESHEDNAVSSKSSSIWQLDKQSEPPLEL